MRHGTDRPRIWLWAVVGITAGIILAGGVIWFVLWTLGLKDADGNQLIDAPGAVVIGGILALLTAAATPLLTVLAGWLRQILHQVKNSHKENFRDDMDGKHDELVAKLDAMAERFDGFDGRFDRMERRVNNAEAAIELIQHPKEKP